MSASTRFNLGSGSTRRGGSWLDNSRTRERRKAAGTKSCGGHSRRSNVQAELLSRYCRMFVLYHFLSPFALQQLLHLCFRHLARCLSFSYLISVKGGQSRRHTTTSTIVPLSDDKSVVSVVHYAVEAASGVACPWCFTMGLPLLSLMFASTLTLARFGPDQGARLRAPEPTEN